MSLCLSPNTRRLLQLGVVSLSLISGLALASGGGDGYRKNDKTKLAPDCAQGQVWNSAEASCGDPRSSALSDSDRTAYAYRLARAGRYQEALALLDTLRQPNTAEALNYRGYATRKLGRTDEGITYYLKSVQLDPHYAKVREYLGEAYVIKGRMDLAHEQLQSIQGLCGTACEEYRDLAEAIAHPQSL